jgi:hypothetical protein
MKALFIAVFVTALQLATAAKYLPRVPSIYRFSRCTLGSLRGGQAYFTHGRDVEYYEDEELIYYDDDSAAHRHRSKSTENGRGFPLAGLDSFVGGTNRKLGFGLSIAGGLVTSMGVIFFFNSFFLRVGNILFLSGLPMIVGPGRTVAYFTNSSRLRATVTLLFGMFLVVFAGWPITGLLVEIFGFLNLFGNLFPLLRVFLRQIPGMAAREDKFNEHGY